MLLLMLERGMPIDMVLTADTGMEFPEMYAHLAKLDEHLLDCPWRPADVGRILRTFKIKKNVEVTDNGKDNF